MSYDGGEGKPTKKKTAAQTKAILKEANERFEDVRDRDAENRRNHSEDVRFVYVPGAQSDKKIKERWGDDPLMEFNQLGQFVNQVINDQRQARPGIQVHPAGGKASADVAEIEQGLIRHIEYDSQAESAYDHGLQGAVVGGRGYWRIISEYETPKSFDQKLKIRAIDDALSVDLDPDFTEPDGSDRKFGFVTETFSKEEFADRWPDADPVSWKPGDKTTAWYTDDGKRVVVADYYRRICKQRTLVQLVDGSSAFDDELPEGAEVAVGNDGEPISRDTDDYRVEWYKIAGGEQLLETYEWPGSIIPIVCCMGDVYVDDGKRYYRGLVRPARDPQKMYNYEKSMKALLLNQAPLAPWVGPANSFAGFEDIWKTANKARHAYLPYNLIDVDGKAIPPPTRAPFPPVPTGWAEAAQSDKDDIKSTIGMYNNSLGQHGQETSGKAILAREKQGDTATFHFADNMARAIALTGRILVEAIPHYYDAQRLVTVIAKDDTRKMVTVNEPVQHLMADGTIDAIIMNNLSVGEYAVTVEAGPSYATAREQTREHMMALVQSDPAIMQVAGDIIVGAMDFPDSEELAERLKLMLPPPIQQHLQSKEEGDDKAAPPDPAMMQQMQQMQQQTQMMQEELQKLQQENAQLKSGAEAKMKEAQARMQLSRDEAEQEAKLAMEKAKLDASVKVEVARINAETDLIIAGQQTPPELSAVSKEFPPDPSLAMMKQLGAHIQQLSEQVMAPRQHKFEVDDQGNVVGATSRAVQGMR